MSAIEEALRRGEEARRGKGRWTPVGVEFRGRLTARFEGGRSGNERIGVQYVGGQYIQTNAGFDVHGNAHVTVIREAELKTRTKAMITAPTDDAQDELVRECWSKVKEELATKTGNGSKARRKR